MFSAESHLQDMRNSYLWLNFWEFLKFLLSAFFGKTVSEPVVIGTVLPLPFLCQYRLLSFSKFNIKQCAPWNYRLQCIVSESYCFLFIRLDCRRYDSKKYSKNSGSVRQPEFVHPVWHWSTTWRRRQAVNQQLPRVQPWGSCRRRSGRPDSLWVHHLPELRYSSILCSCSPFSLREPLLFFIPFYLISSIYLISFYTP